MSYHLVLLFQVAYAVYIFIPSYNGHMRKETAIAPKIKRKLELSSSLGSSDKAMIRFEVLRYVEHDIFFVFKEPLECYAGERGEEFHLSRRKIGKSKITYGLLSLGQMTQT